LFDRLNHQQSAALAFGKVCNTQIFACSKTEYRASSRTTTTSGKFDATQTIAHSSAFFQLFLISIFYAYRRYQKIRIGTPVPDGA